MSCKYLLVEIPHQMDDLVGLWPGEMNVIRWPKNQCMYQICYGRQWKSGNYWICWTTWMRAPLNPNYHIVTHSRLEITIIWKNCSLWNGIHVGKVWEKCNRQGVWLLWVTHGNLCLSKKCRIVFERFLAHHSQPVLHHGKAEIGQ